MQIIYVNVGTFVTENNENKQFFQEGMKLFMDACLCRITFKLH